MGIIEIEGMHFFANHGYYQSEKIVGNEFVANILLKVDLIEAAKSDKLKNTVNYQKVYNIIQQEINQPADLLEHVAYRVIQSVKKHFPKIEKVTFKLSKINPPMGGQIEKVSITLSD